MNLPYGSAQTKPGCESKVRECGIRPAPVETATLAVEKSTMKVNEKKVFVVACGTATAIIIAGAISLLTAQPVAATPQFATQTGKSCTDCHTSPEGGASLTPFGEKFKANGNKLPK
jgi:acetaldehyde dehydrogenase (acetylating)